MDNKTLLAIVLSIAVIIGYQYLASQQQPPVPPKKTQETAQQAVKKEEPPKPAPLPVAVVPVPPAEEKEVRVENSLYSAVLSSSGATIKFWEMKDYRDNAGKRVVLLQKPGVVPALAIGTNTDFDLSHANFSVIGGNLKLDEHNRTGSVVFEYAKGGISVKRTYTFHAGTYRVDVIDQVTGLPHYWITVGSDFGIFDKEASYAHAGPALLQGTDLDELKVKKLKEPKTYKGDLRWIAQEDKYFCAALVPETKVEEARAWLVKDSPVIAFEGGKSVNKFHLYAGPKVQERLEKIGLQDIINYGFFAIIARPLFWILKFFYGFLGNYGWAIILLTLVVRIPFLPLVSKGQKSMKKLQELQPKMNEVKEKYKKDPQKMQKEMMELYKKHKVNPMGGCLPMVAQIPVFFALYKVLLISIELRGAPFMLWITDLSAKDPYYILPIVMGISMFVQQKMTPSGMDPKQQKLMLLMPVVFTFMFMNFASGLVLYWLVNNLLSIIQQFFINRKIASQKA
jgi:YidC/Oxa1 family membrane protein insertase